MLSSLFSKPDLLKTFVPLSETGYAKTLKYYTVDQSPIDILAKNSSSIDDLSPAERASRLGRAQARGGEVLVARGRTKQHR